MKIFVKEEGILVLARDEIALIKEFNNILRPIKPCDEDKTGVKKIRNFQEFLYIYHRCDYNSYPNQNGLNVKDADKWSKDEMRAELYQEVNKNPSKFMALASDKNIEIKGVGKTALAAQIALNIIKTKKRVLMFSLEMGKEQIRDRIISNITGIPFSKVRYGNLESHELDKVVQANMFLSSNKGLLVSEEDELLNITSKIQMEVMRNGVDIVFIDYINLINIMGNNKEEFYRVTECTRLLKKLAKKVNIPIVILAQGKQEAASKMNNKSLEIWDKVAVNDIAGGASIYRDSDIVLGMYRNVELDNKLVRDKLHQEDERNINYNSPSADKNPQCMTLLIKKSRASGKDIIAARWKAENYRISNW